jgi:hypothetical protein
MKQATPCRFCKRTIVIEIHDDALAAMSLPVWLGMAACNACADFREKRRSITGEIGRAAQSLSALQSVNKLTPAAVTAARPPLSGLAAALCELTCRHRNVETFGGTELTEMILENPSRWPQIVSVYERGVGRFASEQRQAA